MIETTSTFSTSNQTDYFLVVPVGFGFKKIFKNDLLFSFGISKQTDVSKSIDVEDKN